MFVPPEIKTQSDKRPTQSFNITTVTMLTVLVISRSASAGNEVPLRSVELRLIDDMHEPVSDAAVTAVGLRVTGHAAMDWETAQVPETTRRSDDLGRVVVDAPTKGRDEQSVTAVVCHISHNDFVTVNTTVSFKDSPATVCLQRGRRIAVSAVDSQNGNRIRHDLFATLSKCSTNQEWQMLSNGVVVSEGVAFDRTHLRLIQLPKDGLPRFSRLIDLTKYGRSRRILMHDVEIRSGLRLEGILDPQVPRPIHNGIIRILVSEGGNDWQDGCDIRADGTFVIDSLPSGEVIQLTAICDGWVSANPSNEEMKAVGMANAFRRLQPSRLYPQVFRSEENLFQPVIRKGRLMVVLCLLGRRRTHAPF
jgi:hypothetical protein